MSAYIWIMLMTIFQIIDGSTTYILVSNGAAFELNPIMAYFMEQFGNLLGLVIPKFVLSLSIFLLVIKYWYKKSTRITFKIMTYIYCCVACFNSIGVLVVGAL